MFYFDPMYLLFMAPAFILMMLAQMYVSTSYSKWSKVAARSRLTGAQAAQRLISSGGLYNVSVQPVSGKLSDHYDPRTKVLNLSPGVYQGTSVASLAVAAHELGHALQDQDGYMPLKLRAALVPAVNIGSYLGWILIFIGLILRLTDLAWLGVLVFSGGLVFAVATLPVELNASARAKQLLSNSGLIVGSDEEHGVNSVLNAAALTYVAAVVTAASQLLYYVLLVSGMGGRRRN
jgi:Zn-dependent membrane protease YugP